MTKTLVLDIHHGTIHSSDEEYTAEQGLFAAKKRCFLRVMWAFFKDIPENPFF
jgi:hypothetical protein